MGSPWLRKRSRGWRARPAHGFRNRCRPLGNGGFDGGVSDLRAVISTRLLCHGRHGGGDRDVAVKVINAAGHLSSLGGSVLSPGVCAAMERASTEFVDMRSML